MWIFNTVVYSMRIYTQQKYSRKMVSFGIITIIIMYNQLQLPMVMLGSEAEGKCGMTALHPSSYCQHAQRSSGYWPPVSWFAVRQDLNPGHDNFL